MDAADHALAFLIAAWQWFWPICSFVIAVAGGIWGLIKAWPALRRAFNVSDTVAVLPELIEGLRADVKAVKAQTQALEEKSDRKEAKLEVIEKDLAEMKEGTEARLVEWSAWRNQMDGIYAELTHNGGSSLKDSIARLELKVNGYEQLPGETLEAAAARLRYSQSSQTGEISAVDSPA